MVEVKALRCYAYHGCQPEERLVGGWFEVDIRVECDFSAAAAADNISLAIDYVRLMELATATMANPVNLIETVATAIAKSIKHEWPTTGQVHVEVRKMNAPAGFEHQYVAVCCVEK